MECPSPVLFQPSTDFGMLTRSAITEDDVNDLAGRDTPFQGSEKADQFLMPAALHVLPEHLFGQRVESSAQCRCAVVFVIMGHGGAAPFLQWKPGLRAIKDLNLRFLIDVEDQDVCRRTDIGPDDIAKLLDKGWFVGQLEPSPAMRDKAMHLPDFLNRENRRLCNPPHAARGSMRRFVRRRLQASAAHDCLRRIRGRHARGCLPAPSASTSTIRVRQTYFCGVLRSLARTSSRCRLISQREPEILLRMARHTQVHTNGQGILGLFRFSQATIFLI